MSSNEKKRPLQLTAAALRTRWWALRHPETMLWLAYCGTQYTDDIRYGWRGREDQVNRMRAASPAAAVCMAVELGYMGRSLQPAMRG